MRAALAGAGALLLVPTFAFDGAPTTASAGLALLRRVAPEHPLPRAPDSAPSIEIYHLQASVELDSAVVEGGASTALTSAYAGLGFRARPQRWDEASALEIGVHYVPYNVSLAGPYLPSASTGWANGAAVYASEGGLHAEALVETTYLGTINGAVYDQFADWVEGYTARRPLAAAYQPFEVVNAAAFAQARAEAAAAAAAAGEAGAAGASDERSDAAYADAYLGAQTSDAFVWECLAELADHGVELEPIHKLERVRLALHAAAPPAELSRADNADKVAAADAFFARQAACVAAAVDAGPAPASRAELVEGPVAACLAADAPKPAYLYGDGETFYALGALAAPYATAEQVTAALPEPVWYYDNGSDWVDWFLLFLIGGGFFCGMHLLCLRTRGYEAVMGGVQGVRRRGVGGCDADAGLRQRLSDDTVI